MQAPEKTEANDEGRKAADESAEVERLKEELRREHDMLLRSLADFDNYRRRVDRDRGTAARSGKREVILSLLEVLDGFDRALEHIGDAPSSVAQGVEAIHRNLLSVLDRHGVTAFNSVGETFDPHLHEAVQQLQDDEHPPGTIVEVIEDGYMLDDRLLRPTRAIVAGPKLQEQHLQEAQG